jgi:hypothetical protein
VSCFAWRSFNPPFSLSLPTEKYITNDKTIIARLVYLYRRYYKNPLYIDPGKRLLFHHCITSFCNTTNNRKIKCVQSCFKRSHFLNDCRTETWFPQCLSLSLELIAAARNFLETPNSRSVCACVCVRFLLTRSGRDARDCSWWWWGAQHTHTRRSRQMVLCSAVVTHSPDYTQ